MHKFPSNKGTKLAGVHLPIWKDFWATLSPEPTAVSASIRGERRRMDGKGRDEFLFLKTWLRQLQQCKI